MNETPQIEREEIISDAKKQKVRYNKKLTTLTNRIKDYKKKIKEAENEIEKIQKEICQLDNLIFFTFNK